MSSMLPRLDSAQAQVRPSPPQHIEQRQTEDDQEEQAQSRSSLGLRDRARCDLRCVDHDLYFLPMRSSAVIIMSVCLFLFGGCVEQKLSVTSEPDGALVYLNNEEVGRTPLE